MGFKEEFGELMVNHQRNVDQTFEGLSEEEKKGAFEERLRTLVVARHHLQTSLETEEKWQTQQRQYEVQRQQLGLAKEAEAFRFQQRENELSIEKQYDEFERLKQENRIKLDQQRQEISLDRERFDYEQKRADKAQDYQHELNVGELLLRKSQEDHKHEYNMGQLAYQRELARYQHIQNERVFELQQQAKDDLREQLVRQLKEFENEDRSIDGIY